MSKIKVSIMFNFIIVLLVIIATIFMMNGICFMGEETSLTETGVGFLKYFTVQSNILIGIIAFTYMVLGIRYISGRIEEIPTWIYILKLIFTVSVMITFITTAFFLAPGAKNGYFSLFKNSNLLYHLVIPLLSFITFVFFEKNEVIKFKYVYASILPILIYGIFYTINVFAHTENGKILPRYDWYGFVKGGLWSIFISFPVMLILTFSISIITWNLNKKQKKV